MNKKLILGYSITFGVLSGLGCFLFFIAMYYTQPNPLNFRRPDIGINIILIWAAIWYYKRYNGGYLHFYEGFSIGFLTNLIASLISGILVYLFIEVVDNTPFITWIAEAKLFLTKERDLMKTILDDANFKRQLVSLDNSKPYQIILDELMFKQISIIPISLISMTMRKINK
ncbi:MAG: DUF4199 domain-containing protein [Cytophagaceae bacterium]|nr:DUF4199 domain-containing protein [Cytophagaceae bacterium]MBK9508384.1 DUF4199 domain-containing protein [Cytophagaceae bacterium]